MCLGISAKTPILNKLAWIRCVIFLRQVARRVAVRTYCSIAAGMFRAIQMSKPRTLIRCSTTSRMDGERPRSTSLVSYPPLPARQRPELLEAGVNPLMHFVKSGHSEGTNPNHLFDVSYYRQLYSDITPETNPLVHYLSFGGVELRSTHPLLDPLAYCQSNPEMLEPGSNPLLHYFQYGIVSGVVLHVLFDAPFYLSQVPSLIGIGQDPVLHYIETGERLGLNPSALFDTSFYLERYPEVSASGQNALVHFVSEGYSCQLSTPTRSSTLLTTSSRMAMLPQQAKMRWCIICSEAPSKGARRAGSSIRLSISKLIPNYGSQGRIRLHTTSLNARAWETIQIRSLRRAVT